MSYIAYSLINDFWCLRRRVVSNTQEVALNFKAAAKLKLTACHLTARHDASTFDAGALSPNLSSLDLACHDGLSHVTLVTFEVLNTPRPYVGRKPDVQ